jgi:CubicO group peptidase (beta-lactamase class C family)
MHLGSLTKAITATLIGALTEKGRMTPETTLEQAFPELSPKMHPAYRKVTARQLLTHTSGVAQYRTLESLRPLLSLKGTDIDQRRAFVQRVLAQRPGYDPGTKREYSNAGPAIAGAMAERLGGAPYRELVEQLVFAPLGGRAGFGNPGLGDTPQPWGHIRGFFGIVSEVVPDDAAYTTPLAIEPAGDASPTLRDYGRFLQLHLRGLRGRDTALKAQTIQNLHGRVAPTDPAYGSTMGWTVMPRDGVASHEHVGSYGAYIAFATVQPSRDVAVATFTNIGGGQDLKDALGRLALRTAAQLSSAGLTAR